MGEVGNDCSGVYVRPRVRCMYTSGGVMTTEEVYIHLRFGGGFSVQRPARRDISAAIPTEYTDGIDFCWGVSLSRSLLVILFTFQERLKTSPSLSHSACEPLW